MTPRAGSARSPIGILPIALILALWQALAGVGHGAAVMLPPPAAVFARLSSSRQPAISGTMPRSRCSGCSPASPSRS